MNEIVVRFYSLKTHEQKLPLLVRLLTRALSENLKIVICCENKEQQEEIDEFLWKEADFLPHTISGDEAAKYAPILLVCEPERAPSCQLLIQLGTKFDTPRGCERIFEIVCDNDPPQMMAHTRERYRLYQQRGFKPQFHKL